MEKLHQKIDKIWAWLSVDENGNELIFAHGTMEFDAKRKEIHHFPIIIADATDIKSAQEVADSLVVPHGNKIIMAEFVRVK